MIQVKEFEGIYGIDTEINRWLSSMPNIDVIDIKQLIEDLEIQVCAMQIL